MANDVPPIILPLGIDPKGLAEGIDNFLTNFANGAAKGLESLQQQLTGIRGAVGGVGAAIESELNEKLAQIREVKGPEKVIDALEKVAQVLASTIPNAAPLATQAIESLNQVLNADSSNLAEVSAAQNDFKRNIEAITLAIKENELAVQALIAARGQISDKSSSDFIKDDKERAAAIEEINRSIGILKTQSEQLRTINGILSTSFSSVTREVKVLSDAEKAETSTKKQEDDTTKNLIKTLEAEAAALSKAADAAKKRSDSATNAAIKEEAEAFKKLTDAHFGLTDAQKKLTQSSNSSHDQLLAILGIK
jgi:hypothetical protein